MPMSDAETDTGKTTDAGKTAHTDKPTDADRTANLGKAAAPHPRRRHNQLPYRGRSTNRLAVHPARRGNQRAYRSLPMPANAGKSTR
jgi:hypothetical protein